MYTLDLTDRQATDSADQNYTCMGFILWL